jgi:uncharacterized DUF497 family protein
MAIQFTYNFDPEKNKKLIELRNISFEEIIVALESAGLLDVIMHPNAQKYPHQKMYVVALDGYAYLVPFVETKSEIFLKTAFPSRKATKQYLGSTDEVIYDE